MLYEHGKCHVDTILMDKCQLDFENTMHASLIIQSHGSVVHLFAVNAISYGLLLCRLGARRFHCKSKDLLYMQQQLNKLQHASRELCPKPRVHRGHCLPPSRRQHHSYS